MTVAAVGGVPRALAGARLLSPEVAELVAIENGVCIRPLAMRVLDEATGVSRIVNVACGARLESKCPSCAKRNRQVRMAQCREGWHVEEEPVTGSNGDGGQVKESAGTCMIDSAGEVQAGDGARRVRSTRRRQDAPKLPRRDRSASTLGRTFTTSEGKVYRPSMFVTLTLPSYGRVRGGVPVDPERYDYAWAARDALHFSKLVDRFVQNLRRVAGWDVQYFASVEFQKRLAPHLHMAVRGTMARAELRRVIEATYHQVWWPAVDRVVYDGDLLPVWRDGAGYVDPESGVVLESWDEALDRLGENQQAAPLHVARFGVQADIRGVLAGTADADQCIRYLAKYLTKSVDAGALGAEGAKGRARRAHAARLVEALRFEPCSPGCANWLRYGVQPKDAKSGLVPGRCRGKAHRAQHLGYGGRRVLVSRKWSGRTMGQHCRDRRAWVLEALGIEQEASESQRFVWELLSPSHREVPPLRLRLLALVAERQQWRREMERAKSGSGELGVVR
ncbi:replication initiator [Nonomuraea sp. NPDC026600]|uniref:replication initiator n=1 Tax=Nonomuraea sp. NPDC026600 TaxID=3155363 RepID=UPI0034017792